MRVSAKARMNRLFRNGRCLDVAIDHGVCNEPTFMPGLEDIGGVVDRLIAWRDPLAAQISHLKRARTPVVDFGQGSAQVQRWGGNMGKYDRLQAYLQAHAAEEVTLSFRKIENIIGTTLPDGALKPQWWSNVTATQSSHIQRLRVAWGAISGHALRRP